MEKTVYVEQPQLTNMPGFTNMFGQEKAVTDSYMGLA